MAKRRMRTPVKIFLSLVVLLLIAIVAGLATWSYVNSPVEISSEITFEVESGSTSAVIAADLKEAGLIRSELAFRYYLGQEGLGSSLKPGEYTFLAGSVSYEDITAQLITGTQAATFNITISEGKTVMEIGEILEGYDLCTLDEFLDYAANGDFSEYEFIEDTGIYTRLEGYLFPETYNIGATWSMEQVVTTMLDQFVKEFSDEWIARADELGMTIAEVVTLASIIEREAQVAEDRPIISGVFHNRLDIGMLLQSCATVQYALGEVKSVLTYDDIAIDSPYNTYINYGLPPTPIGVPGRDSLEAALYPTETDYLYFVAKSDGSHAFGVTYTDHLYNISLYQ